MKRNDPRKWLLHLAAVILAVSFTVVPVFADWRGGHSGGGRSWGGERHFSGGRHEDVHFRGERFVFHEGRFFRPRWWGFSFDWVIPPVGVEVSYLPVGCTAVVIGGVTYYTYDNVYYQPYGAGYMVVTPPPVTDSYISPNVVYMPPAAQAQAAGDRETVTVNVPTANKGTVGITLLRNGSGFVGPQNEFYPALPTGDELRSRYGN